ncbi:hypothetical protein [Yinghuangia seranimata]|uniref:hypothetical protein n=1 Tax=Yinghuangia seranimata TaxID=408067 RepID=UPI00248C3FFA|nr:hypothetical protein [Yinghuangia seranimata]MDI2125487.1 hypothetical protein [Yinghuangia seranimata]
MELAILLVLPLPLGYFVRDRLAAYLAYVAVHSYVFTFQTMTLTKAWVGGDHSAFAKDPDAVEWAYGAVNLAFYAVGLTLVAAGRRLRARRTGRAAGVDLAAGDRA